MEEENKTIAITVYTKEEVETLCKLAWITSKLENNKGFTEWVKTNLK